MIPEHQKLIKKRSAGGELTCIICPIGCRMTVQQAEKDGALKIEGNRCKRGVAYAQEEFSDPRRIVTATCSLDNAAIRRLPVKSSAGVPIDMIPAFLNELYALRISAPVRAGQILSSNLAGSGADLIAGVSVDPEK